MVSEAAAGLRFADHISRDIDPDPFGRKHNEFKKIFKIRGRKYRKPGKGLISSLSDYSTQRRGSFQLNHEISFKATRFNLG